MDGMVIEIFVLSILRSGPVHGYELKRRVQRPSLTPLSNNSLYPMLRRFEVDGLVTKTIEQQDGTPARKVYAITDAGRDRLRTLLCSLPPELATSDEEFLVRMSFFHEIPIPARRAILAARAAVLDGASAQVGELLAESESTEARAWRRLAMQRVLDTTNSERAWLAEIAKKAETE
jgi:DNA-binding PadR family transcriptional regulator